MCMTKETFKKSNVVSKKKKKNHTTLQHWNFDTTLQCCNVVMLCLAQPHPELEFSGNFFLEIRRFEKRIALSEKNPPLDSY